jgi:hypothetical protein
MPPFYALDAELPLFLAITSGLQHALAMLAGLITPPIIFAGALKLDSATSAYLISASLIGCGKYSPSMIGGRIELLRRHPQSRPDVSNKTVQGLLFGHGIDLGRRDEFCNAQHRKRSALHCSIRHTICLNVPFEDLQCDVQGWHMPFDNCI